ncbi:unnamed protein product [Rhizoctonia solani]|uniref:DUF7918 domain-containing protein n=1 Tax=Rhizoctonia solani TaxID=456999 RepID=A0A8H3BEM4_9AGAM|nr:unnamed protein product [Rhizoctonia solani]
MFLKSLGLRVYITDASGSPLSEYQEVKTADNAIECWIPSEEGTNFQIHWEVLDRTPMTAGCCSCATPYFDGVKLKSKIAPNGKNKGRLYGHPVAPSTIRLYQFGKRTFTDEEDTSVANAMAVEDLGTIRLKIEWGKCVQKDKRTLRRFTDPKPGPVHEKLAKRGFWDSAGLGQTAEVHLPAFGKFIRKEEASCGNFVFRYASEDSLKARGIRPIVSKIELSPKLEDINKSEPLDIQLGRKRVRAASPEATGSDRVENDDRIPPLAKKHKP